MAAISIANIKKTVYYLQRNGLKSTWYAARERLEERRKPPYRFEPVSEEKLQEQRDSARSLWETRGGHISFSILVPAYRTEERYLREMISSVCSQTYPYWELIIADATEDDSVSSVVMQYENAELIAQGQELSADMDPNRFCAGRILCIKLQENRGISDNTNAALPYIRGSYAGLLDHDDMLTENALYEMAERIRAGHEQGTEIQLLYSDEDKCSEDGTVFYEPNRKEKFNLDLILSNNYICHLMVMRSGLIRKLGFRREYEGAQDYDLILRAITSLQLLSKPQEENRIVHIPLVLYHWRCHAASTAQNPHSKEYAYEAGRRALKDFAGRSGLACEVVQLRHVGFYALSYTGDPLEIRMDLGAVGGRIINRNKIVGGRMDEAGSVFYKGLPAAYSGYLHRAVLTQDADAVDIRCIAVKKELYGVFEQEVGVPYRCIAGGAYFDASAMPADADYRELSLKFCKAVRQRGYRILWMPSISNLDLKREMS